MIQLQRFTLHTLQHQLPSLSACATALAQKLYRKKGFVGLAPDTFLMRGLPRQQWVGYISHTSPGQKSYSRCPLAYNLFILMMHLKLNIIMTLMSAERTSSGCTNVQKCYSVIAAYEIIMSPC